MEIKFLGQFSGKERGYHRTYPETEKVIYRIYIISSCDKYPNGKEFGIPLGSSLEIGELIEKDQASFLDV